jgi:bacteriocin biosynthesis cyclodehydratase domain-containing protein
MSEARYRLRSSVEAVRGGDGSLFLVRACEDDLVVRDAQPGDHALLALLGEGEPSLAELSAALGLDAEPKLTSLIAAGVVVEAASSPPLADDDAQRYARQLPYLADFGDERDLQRRVSSARVTVVGCGGLGTWAICALAAAGVRRFRVVDDDVVELSNLNRQVLYNPAQLGSAKTGATVHWLRSFDARMEVEEHRLRVDGPAAAEAVVEDADVLVLAADSPPYELARWINRACVRARVPFITAGQLPPLAKVGPLYRPGRTACFTCHERALRRESQDYDGYVEHIGSAPVRGATLGPASGVVGSMLAMELLHLLIGVEPASAGAALLIDLRPFGVRREPIARDPACPDCQPQARQIGSPAAAAGEAGEGSSARPAMNRPTASASQSASRRSILASNASRPMTLRPTVESSTTRRRRSAGSVRRSTYPCSSRRCTMAPAPLRESPVRFVRRPCGTAPWCARYNSVDSSSSPTRSRFRMARRCWIAPSSSAASARVTSLTRK